MSDQSLEADSVLSGGEAQPSVLEPYVRGGGLAVVLLDALTRYRCQWVEEEELAMVLKLNKRKCFQLVQYFEAERFLRRKTLETAIGDPGTKSGASSSGHGIKSYCCLDYPQICDVTRYKLNLMKRNLKDKLGNKLLWKATYAATVKEVYDAMQLGSFECESCFRELVREGDDDSNNASRDGRKRRKTNLANKLQRMQEQLEPLASLLDMIEKLPVLEFLYLHDDDSSRSCGHDPVRVLGEKKVEASSSLNRTAGAEEDIHLTESKILPGWMIREGMLQKDTDSCDDSVHNESIQDAYAKAHAEAYAKAFYEAYPSGNPEAARREDI